jgi:hypothetical protein
MSEVPLMGASTLTSREHSAVRQALDDIRKTTLKSKKALQRMLDFIVTNTLEERDESLKEYSIATLVFNKRDSFDPRMSSLVRTQACKLRRALIDHYTAFPNPTGPWIWVPPGSYHPIFNFNPATRAAGGATPNGLPLLIPERVPRIAPPTTLSRGSDLQSIADGVVKMQQEHLTWREGIESLAATVGDRAKQRATVGLVGEGVPTIEQTVIELEGRLLLTMCLTAGTSRSVLYAHSLSVPWSGNVDRALAEVGPHVSDFAASCLTLVRPPARSSSTENTSNQATSLLGAMPQREHEVLSNG